MKNVKATVVETSEEKVWLPNFGFVYTSVITDITVFQFLLLGVERSSSDRVSVSSEMGCQCCCS